MQHKPIFNHLLHYVVKMQTRLLILLLSLSFIGTFTAKAFEEFPPTEQYHAMGHNKTAIGIVCYNRPDYFDQLMDSLEANHGIEDYTIFFFLDGGRGALQPCYIERINRSTVPHKIIIAQQKNFGVERHNIVIRKFLFDYCEFDRIVLFDDDVVLAPEHLTLLKHLDQWAHSTYDNIGTVQLWEFCFLPQKEKVNHLNEVVETFAGLFACSMRKTVWDQIKDGIYEFDAEILPNLSSMTDQDHRFWQYSLWMKKKQNPLGKHIFHRILAYEDTFFRKSFCTSQDRVVAIMLYLKGFVRLTTTVNRCINIGDMGVYSDPQYGSRELFNKTTLDTFKDDLTRTTFKVVQPSGFIT